MASILPRGEPHIRDVNQTQGSPHLKSSAMEFSATDWMHATRKPNQGNTVAMYVTSGTVGELQEIFHKLSLGADPDLLDELHDMPFGIYGHLADKFGVHWFFRGETA